MGEEALQLIFLFDLRLPVEIEAVQGSGVPEADPRRIKDQ